jgi:predicted AAA+ superfamily ATPase
MKRIYTTMIEHHLADFRQMAFIAGPRQVGKTTCSKMLAAQCDQSHYLNWDNTNQRKLLMRGPDAVATSLHLMTASKAKSLIVFDEIHKYRKWKLFLKGFFDLYEDQASIVVTGSTKLDLYRRGGDSLMGRYFLYRMHPLSVAELLTTSLRKSEIISSQCLGKDKFQQLMTYGGFPEPFTKADRQFSNNWQRLRKQQLLKEDIRELSQIQDLAHLEFLIDILIEEASTQLNVATISNQLNIAQSTITRWINTLKTFYFCFTIKPWHQNVRRAIRKMPKIYLWDWSLVKDIGKKHENFIASHLLKAVHFWIDSGFGDYDLFYLRDKEKREVDFLVTKDRKPWFLVEVKTSSNAKISENLVYFQELLKVPHAFQVVIDMDEVEIDCFSYKKPIIVPASTFLSQLV